MKMQKLIAKIMDDLTTARGMAIEAGDPANRIFLTDMICRFESHYIEKPVCNRDPRICPKLRGDCSCFE